jgi:hypothetical protein
MRVIIIAGSATATGDTATAANTTATATNDTGTARRSTAAAGKLTRRETREAVGAVCAAVRSVGAATQPRERGTHVGRAPETRLETLRGWRETGERRECVGTRNRENANKIEKLDQKLAVQQTQCSIWNRKLTVIVIASILRVEGTHTQMQYLCERENGRRVTELGRRAVPFDRLGRMRRRDCSSSSGYDADANERGVRTRVRTRVGIRMRGRRVCDTGDGTATAAGAETVAGTGTL